MLSRIPLVGLDRKLFFFGLFTFAVAISTLILLLIFDQKIFIKAISVMAASLTGGRSAAILAGLELKLPNAVISAVIFTINLAWLCTVFPLFIYFYHHLTDLRYIGKMLESTRTRAEKEKEWLVKWGSWALPVFIWLPLPFTGSFAGAVVGFLMGLPLKKIIIIDILSMAVGVITWTWGFEYLLIVTGTAGKIITWTILLVLIVYTYLLNRWQNQNEKKNKPIE